MENTLSNKEKDVNEISSKNIKEQNITLNLEKTNRL